MKFPIVTLALFFSKLAFSQAPSGYWDNQRITNKEISLSTGDKIVVKSEDFPIGTTEFAYRITLLDENQKMVSDLSSVLKAIPDPYYIGKGAGGAISLLSTISGSDKCTYAIFQDPTKAANYVKTDKLEEACLSQKKAVSKDAKVVSLSKNSCLDDQAKSVWFVFKNENWLMNEKIVLEIVPWVDAIASRGWTKKNKESILAKIYLEGATQLVKKEYKEKYGFKMVELLSKEFRFDDFLRLSPAEQKLAIEKNEDSVLAQIGLPNAYNQMKCIQAENMAKEGKMEEAINYILDKVIAKSNATALNYNSLAQLYIQSNQLEKALKTLETAEKLDKSELRVQMNLAHVYMFLDEVSKCKEIHKRYLNQNISSKQTWKNKAINDLDAFKKTSLPQENIAKIWRLYN